jgi:hypothetical protein
MLFALLRKEESYIINFKGYICKRVKATLSKDALKINAHQIFGPLSFPH